MPGWKDRYVAYARLKRKLEKLRALRSRAAGGKGVALTHLELDSGDEKEKEEKGRVKKKDSPRGYDADVKSWVSPKSAHNREAELSRPLIDGETSEELGRTVSEGQLQEEEFLSEVEMELDRVAGWYLEKVTALEAKVRSLTNDSRLTGPSALRGGEDDSEAIEAMHLEAVRLTEFVLLNVEALRKIVKKMDKQCGTSYQKGFVEQKLKRSHLATPGNTGSPFNGERARACRRALEQLVSPERLQELRSKAMSAGGAGLSTLKLRPRRALFAVALAVVSVPLSASHLPGKHRAQRCVGLLTFTVAMWISEAAPFEATAMLVPPLACALSLLKGSREHQAKKILEQVFNESLYLVLCGFVISSVFSRCQLDQRAASFLQQNLGNRPFLFMLAIMFLGVGLSALLSNVTAPLLLVEVIKPLLRDLPTDSRYSRALLLGLAFSCNVGGMMTPISSPQNVAALQALEQHLHTITWAEWLGVSIPFCSAAVLLAYGVILIVYQFDRSPEEAERDARERQQLSIPAVVYEKRDLTAGELAALLGASATLAAFATTPVTAVFGGAPMVAVLFVALALGMGTITRQTFNSYSWHLLFLIGGGSALGAAVRGSGLLEVLTLRVRRHLAHNQWLLVAELAAVLVGATTFVSHTVAALVLMPLVVELGSDAGAAELSVLIGALACSTACALPMTSFPNVNSLLAVDDHGKPWLGVRHFLLAGIPMTLLTAILLVTFGYWLASVVVSADYIVTAA